MKTVVMRVIILTVVIMTCDIYFAEDNRGISNNAQKG